MLKNMPLPDILQSLRANRQKGILTLQKGRREFHLYIDGDRVMHVNPGRSSERYLPEILSLRFDVPLDAILPARKNEKQALAEVMRRLGKTKPEPEDVHEVHAVYLMEALYNAFNMTEGNFSFHQAARPEEFFDSDQMAISLKLEIEPIIMEAMRRQDEWRELSKVFPSMEEVFVARDVYENTISGMDETERDLLLFCDGRHTIRETAYRFGQDLFTTARLLKGLYDKRILRTASSENLAALAEKYRQQGDDAQALRYLRKAVDLDRGNLELREQLAESYAKQGRSEEATLEHQMLAQLYREKEEMPEAARHYRRIIALNPSDVTFRQRLYQLLKTTRDAAACDTGLDLARTYRKLGISMEESAFLMEMRRDFPENITVAELYGDALAKVGKPKEAASQFVDASHAAEKNGDLDAAAGLCRKALEQTPEDKATQKRLERFESGLYAEIREKRKRRLRLAAAVVVAVVIGFYVAYEAIAVAAYLDMRRAALTHVATRNISEITSRARAFESRFPITLMRLDLERYLETVAGLPLPERPQVLLPPTPAPAASRDSFAGFAIGDSVVPEDASTDTVTASQPQR